jgi:thiol-disulfide isomerase/thioredoxin
MRTLSISVPLIAAAALGLALAGESARPSPAFEILRAGNPPGPPLDLKEFRGKVLALAFIDTNCAHCQELTRNVLIPVSREYANRGVQVLECAFNDAARWQVPQFVQQFRPPFPVGWNTRAAVMSYLEISIMDQRPMYVPHMVFLDRAGMIRADYPGESDFFKDAATNVRAELDKLLKPESRAGPRTTARSSGR